MYSFYESTITHAHQQVIFSYEVLLYTKEEENLGTDWELFLTRISYDFDQKYYMFWKLVNSFKMVK